MPGERQQNRKQTPRSLDQTSTAHIRRLAGHSGECLSRLVADYLAMLHPKNQSLWSTMTNAVLLSTTPGLSCGGWMTSPTF